MAITLNGTTGITTPGVTNSGAETIATTLAVTGAATAASLQVGGISTNLYPIVSGTAVASTSGTSIDFTSIPSWVKRITVMFSLVSTSGTSSTLVQLGDSGGIENTGYAGYANRFGGGSTTGGTSTAGFLILQNDAATNLSGPFTITKVDGSTWVAGYSLGASAATNSFAGGGSKTLSATLTQVRITTVNGTDTFDAGSINILYE